MGKFKPSRAQLNRSTLALYASPDVPIPAKRKINVAGKGSESKLQKVCVKWFDLQYPELYYNLWAIPNGGARDAITGSHLKAEGVRPGVSDLMFLYDSQLHCIELKKSGGKLSRSQALFLQHIECYGAKTWVIYSLDDFMRLIRAVVAKPDKKK